MKMIAKVMKRLERQTAKTGPGPVRALRTIIGFSILVSLSLHNAHAQTGKGKIAFVTGRDIGRQVYIVNPDGTTPTRLTKGIAWTSNSSPSLTADGSKLAFISWFANNDEIFIMNADLSGLKQLTSTLDRESQARISPDGRRIVYTKNLFFNGNYYSTDGIWSMNIDGSDQRKLIDGSGHHPSFSPDGRKILFVGVTNQGYGIYVMNADGTRPTLLKKGFFDMQDSVAEPAYSPDGRRIVFCSTGYGSSSGGLSTNIFAMDADGTNEVRLTNGRFFDGDPTFSPDSKQIAFTRSLTSPLRFDSPRNIYVMNADGSGQKRITTAEFDEQPFWAAGTVPPRSMSIESASMTEGDQDNLALEFKVNLSSAATTPVTFNFRTLDGTAKSGSDYLAASGAITFAPGETAKTLVIRIISDKVVESDETFRLVVSNLRGAALATPYATGMILDNDPYLAPTGKIVFASSREGYGNMEIYIMNADGSDQTRLTNSPDYDINPALSPDGRKIAFESRPSDLVPPDIYIMNVDGSNRIRLTQDGSYNMRPRFSPDSKKIVFATIRNGRGDICLMNADGSDQILLTSGETSNEEPSFSPDGRKIVFTLRPTGYVTDRSAAAADIYVMNIDGSGRTRLTNHPAEDRSPTFSPDGKRIAFVSSRSGISAIYAMNVDGSNIIPISTLNTLSYYSGDYSPSYSPDGRRLAFTRLYAGPSQIFVMDMNGSNQIQVTTEGGEAPMWGPDNVPATLPKASINSVRIAEGHSGSKTVLFTATLSQSSRETVAVNYITVNDTALAGSDYITAKGTLVFQPGQTRLTIPVTVKGDTLPEGNETFSVLLISARGATLGTNGTGTILNDDEAALSIALSTPRLKEGPAGTPGTSGLIRVSRNTQINRDTPELTVDLVANPANQTSQPARVTIPARAASVLVPITAVDDTVVDGPRNVTLTVLAPGHKRAGTTLAVLDNDVSTTTRTVSHASSSGLSLAQIANDVIRLSFIDALDADSVGTENFAASKNGQAVRIESVSSNGGEVVLTLAPEDTQPGDRLTVRWQDLHDITGKTIADGATELTVR